MELQVVMQTYACTLMYTHMHSRTVHTYTHSNSHTHAHTHSHTRAHHKRALSHTQQTHKEITAMTTIGWVVTMRQALQDLGEFTCPRPHSQIVAEQHLNPDPSNSKFYALNH